MARTTLPKWIACLVLFGGGIFAGSERAEAQPKAAPFAKGLHAPTGVAVDLSRKVVFVAEGGAGRVLRIDQGKPTPVVVGFPRGSYGPSNALQVGLAGLRIVEKDMLATLDLGNAEGWDAVSLYKIPESGKPPAEYSAATVRLGPMEPRAAARPPGFFAGLGSGSQMIFFGAVGDEPHGNVYRALATNEKWNVATRFVPTRDVVGAGFPSAILMTPKTELLVAQAGSLDQPGDSLLSYYHPITGRLLLNHATGLHDIVALAQSHVTGQLYALDIAWNRPADAGLYHIVSEFKQGRLGVAARKILPLTRPVAMAFSFDGKLLVAVLGPADADPATSGQLLAIDGDL